MPIDKREWAVMRKTVRGDLAFVTGAKNSWEARAKADEMARRRPDKEFVIAHRDVTISEWEEEAGE